MIKIDLVDDWRRSWRWGSVHLGWSVGLIPGLIAAYPDDASALFGSLAAMVHNHPWLAVPLTIIAGGIPWIARIITLRRSWHPRPEEQP